ncbi:MAG: glutamine-hydrolyzing GMP synthase [Acidobacteriales bacterium]|nr:glutamine-hydrolyzing GMP synthase [Terriglobales bacterium]
MQKLVVLDAGGQYCHLIARRLRHLGIYADVKPCSTPSAELAAYMGIIVSGGPSSVYDDTSPTIDARILDLHKPILGICYGHQLLARMLGGTVARGEVAEYGLSRLAVITEDSIFRDAPKLSSAWMSHRDLVTSVPAGFELLAKTDTCPVAAMGDHARRIYGVQFHPEVAHTRIGNRVLKSFCVDVCGCDTSVWKPAKQIDALVEEIRFIAKGKKVFFFVSGGVDSTVAFVLCLRALGADRVEGVFVDTGFMRDADIQDILYLKEHEHANIHIEDAREEFVRLLRDVYSPERKRELIGEHFLKVHERIMENHFHGHQKEWMLGQGTIYPDTIESGGTQHSSKIKTHHNRVGTLLEMLSEGRVIEPLSQFYKDEVRQIGKALNVNQRILMKQPFPGPGLAIRCICSSDSPIPHPDPVLTNLAAGGGFAGSKVDLKTVGVKGDERSYQSIVILSSDGAFSDLESISTQITNQVADVTRVLYLASEDVFRPEEWYVRSGSYVTEERLSKLRAADSYVRRYMLVHHNALMETIWQFPVILLPLVNKRADWESVVLRPVDSVDGMTASFSPMPKNILTTIARRIHEDLNLHVFFDATNKPPATIEWE